MTGTSPVGNSTSNELSTLEYNKKASDFKGNLQLAKSNKPAQGDAPKDPQKDKGITDAEREAAAKGDAETFWKGREEQGDPIAKAGLASLHPKGGVIDYLFGGTSINKRLEAFSRVYTGHSADIEGIRKDLMQAHMEKVDEDVKNDKKGVKGLLDPGQVYDYHKEVFEKHGLPSTAFGGSPHTGQRWEAYATSSVWCSGYDK